MIRKFIIKLQILYWQDKICKLIEDRMTGVIGKTCYDWHVKLYSNKLNELKQKLN